MDGALEATFREETSAFIQQSSKKHGRSERDMDLWKETKQVTIKGPDKPTNQLLPTSRKNKFKRDGEGRIHKGEGGGLIS